MFNERMKHSFPCLPSPSVIMCCSPNHEPVRVATHYCRSAWANIKTQEKNVISSLLYTFSKSNTFEKKSTTFVLQRSRL